MAVRIRLTRMGNRNNPFYRIVAANAGDSNQGKAIEYLGTYDPKSGGRVVLKTERYQHWIGVGALPSDTVKSLVPRAIEHATTKRKTPAAATKQTASTDEATEEAAAPAAEAAEEAGKETAETPVE